MRVHIPVGDDQVTGRHRTVGRHRACRKPVSMWPRLGLIGTLAVITTGPALIFNIVVGPEAYAGPLVLSPAATISAPAQAALPVLAAPSRGGFYAAQPRVDLMVRQVYAAINPTHDAANGGDGSGSEGGSHYTTTANVSDNEHVTKTRHHKDTSDSDTSTDQLPTCH